MLTKENTSTKDDSLEFKENGFVITDVLSEKDLNSLKSSIAHGIARQLDASLSGLDQHSQHRHIFTYLEELSKTDPSLADWILQGIATHLWKDPRVKKISEHAQLKKKAAELIGLDIDDMTIRFRASSPFTRNKQQDWHTDVALLDGGDCTRVRLACWIPLCDVDESFGGLELIPGLRNQPPLHLQHQGHYAIDPEFTDQSSNKVRPSCKAGQGIFIDAFTPHRSYPHSIKKTRWSLVIWFKAGAPRQHSLN